MLNLLTKLKSAAAAGASLITHSGHGQRRPKRLKTVSTAGTAADAAGWWRLLSVSLEHVCNLSLAADGPSSWQYTSEGTSRAGVAYVWGPVDLGRALTLAWPEPSWARCSEWLLRGPRYKVLLLLILHPVLLLVDEGERLSREVPPKVSREVMEGNIKSTLASFSSLPWLIAASTFANTRWMMAISKSLFFLLLPGDCLCN